MAAKQSKAIKRLEKQVKKLSASIDEMSREIRNLRDAGGARAGSRFTEEEVEIADEITDEAEEVADILDRS